MISSLPVLISDARRALMQASTLGEVVAVRDRAKALQRMAKGVKGARDAFNRCGELVVEAFAIEGRALAKLDKATGTLLAGRSVGGSPKEQPKDDTPTLAELGISRKESMVAQRIASVPTAELRAHFDDVKAKGGEITLAGALRLAANATRETRVAEVRARETAEPDGTYDVIVLDPPWPMERIDRDVRPHQPSQLDYETMSEGQLQALDLQTADDCHVWLWTTQRFLPMALRLLDGWGLNYVCTFVWHKPGGFQPIGLPQYNCEFAVYARRGSPLFVTTKAFSTCFDAPRGDHSAKPDAFYEMLRRVTAGCRLDMFNRRALDGFVGWGKEAA